MHPLFKESQHPRGPNGRFTRSFARIMSALDRRRRDKAKRDFRPHGFKGPDDARSYLSHLSGVKGPQIREHIASGAVGKATEALRAGKTDVPEVHQIDAAMKPLPDGLDLYRSVPAKQFGKVDPKSLEGHLVSDAGYFPTTVAPVKAAPGNVQLHVQAPAGTHAAVDPDTGQVILDHGTQMSVEHVDVGPDGSARMDLVALPAETGQPHVGSPSTPGPGSPPRARPAPPVATSSQLAGLIDADPNDEAALAHAEQQLGEVYGGTFGGLNVQVGSVDRATYGDDENLHDNGFFTRLSITDAQGQPVGRAIRSLWRDSDGNLVAGHTILELDPSVQGGRFAADFNAHMEQWYREQGVSRIELTANIDVGGYAWASAGYDFSNEQSAHDVLGLLRDHIDGMQGPDADAARALLARAESEPFGSANYPTPYEISQLGRPEGDAGRGRGARWLGKDIMLSSEWEGVRWL